MDLLIRPGKLQGAVTPPPGKSETQRLIVAAALAEGESRLENVALSEDIRAALACAQALGAAWRELTPGTLTVTGGGARQGEPTVFDCGASGAVLRFFLPLSLALCGGGDFIGHGRLMQRPLEPYLAIFREQGVVAERKGDRLCVRGRLRPGDYRLPGDVSSQFFSGLLFALPLLEAPSRILASSPPESADYIGMTLDMLRRAGVTAKETPGGYAVEPARFRPVMARVEPDWSQAAFWLVAQALGSEVRVEGLRERSLQPDRRCLPMIERLSKSGDVRLDLSQNPDLLPPLTALAALRQGVCRLEGAARLRGKESDRLHTAAAALRAMGAPVRELPDALEIEGCASLRGGAEIDCAQDHRIAMLGAVLATRCEREIVLRGAECVNKSDPDFWDRYQSLGGDCHVVSLG